MNAGLVVQYAVIVLLVLASIAYMVRKLAPKLTTRWQAGVAGALLKPGRAAFAQRIGRALQPRDATGNCGDGCSTCGSCGTDSPPPAENGDEQPLTFRPYRRS
ncbi:MAG TPA: DUF6587 family protein [Paraburkholderia sp.]|jgi:hypothetical protein